MGGVRLQLRPVGPSHTPEDLVVYLPQEKVLFAGDLVFRNRIPFVGQADSRHWIQALDALLTFDAKADRARATARCRTQRAPGHGADARLPGPTCATTMGEAARNLEPFEDA